MKLKTEIMSRVSEINLDSSTTKIYAKVLYLLAYFLGILGRIEKNERVSPSLVNHQVSERPSSRSNDSLKCTFVSESDNCI